MYVAQNILLDLAPRSEMDQLGENMYLLVDVTRTKGAAKLLIRTELCACAGTSLSATCSAQLSRPLCQTVGSTDTDTE